MRPVLVLFCMRQYDRLTMYKIAIISLIMFHILSCSSAPRYGSQARTVSNNNKTKNLEIMLIMTPDEFVVSQCILSNNNSKIQWLIFWFSNLPKLNEPM